MANLKDLIKDAQTGFMADAGNTAGKEPEKPEGIREKENGADNSPRERKEEKKQSERRPGKRENLPGSIVEGIRAVEKGGASDKMVHVRVSDSVHRRLLLYGQEGMKVQSIVSYAIDHLLQTKEMKDLFNKIKNDME